jgi:membrane protease YdiL (CAAX protease family)
MLNNQKELIRNLTDRELLLNLYMTQGILLAVALVIGIWQYDSFSEFAGIWQWDIFEIWMVGGTSGILIVLLDLALMKKVPGEWYDDGGINERIFRHLSLFHLLILCLIISFTEEILFRGVLQVHFGLFWASVIFALMHIRYLSKLFLLVSVVILSFFLGLLFSWTDNLAATITAHFLIDFLLAVHINRQAKQNDSIRGDDHGPA